MIRLLIIDDESNAIENLIWELKNTNIPVDILATFLSPTEAIKFLKSNSVDAIFLDIEMPEMDGFQFLAHFEPRNFAVIITSAYNQYGINAIKSECLDYLQKPIDSDDLTVALQKIQKFKKDQQLINLLENSNLNNSYKNTPKKININLDGKIIYLEPEEIVYCESDGNYTTIHLNTGKSLLVTQQLKQIEDKLSDEFFRIHNSYIVNLNKITEYIKADGYVILCNSAKIPVSRQKKAILLDKL
ncbi:Two-component system response regulatory protein, LytTR family [Flavobacterium indicum GPTSA100-9 = DSM 17447]|uniref:Two-component system response regulatory protein, LytTR family n=1 Tax=Flavobacterium indicum (strain DSM 17447 / CIP 109464 / GPTSA100-9) TaxID=1094466 RepID=H8XT07_FLAIG|nr:LytTR family DNA-binding domain-containing protein [Flavobacterium indicum]CCG53549.1 Two-component system response regulatory protein, LytTR family [Flavobacterium indicum GPTSA100-9 = DSM 17447]